MLKNLTWSFKQRWEWDSQWNKVLGIEGTALCADKFLRWSCKVKVLHLMKYAYEFLVKISATLITFIYPKDAYYLPSSKHWYWKNIVHYLTKGACCKELAVNRDRWIVCNYVLKGIFAWYYLPDSPSSNISYGCIFGGWCLFHLIRIGISKLILHRRSSLPPHSPLLLLIWMPYKVLHVIVH